MLDADKHYKDFNVNEMNCSVSNSSTDSIRPMDSVQESEESLSDTACKLTKMTFSSNFTITFYLAVYMNQSQLLGSISSANSDLNYNDGKMTHECYLHFSLNYHVLTGSKYSYLPSLIECEDTEFDEILNDIEIVDRTKHLVKKDSVTQNKTSFNFFCKSVSSAMDARLDIGLDTNVEISIRRLTMISSLDMYASLPQILTNEFVTTSPETTQWPEYITDIWSGPEFNSGLHTYQMFKSVFDCIFADLHLQVNTDF